MFALSLCFLAFRSSSLFSSFFFFSSFIVHVVFCFLVGVCRLAILCDFAYTLTHSHSHSHTTHFFVLYTFSFFWAFWRSNPVICLRISVAISFSFSFISSFSSYYSNAQAMIIGLVSTSSDINPVLEILALVTLTNQLIRTTHIQITSLLTQTLTSQSHPLYLSISLFSLPFSTLFYFLLFAVISQSSILSTTFLPLYLFLPNFPSPIHPVP